MSYIKDIRLASLNYGDKFKLYSNDMRYIRYGTVNGRIKVKCIGHCENPLVGKDLTKMTFAPNCKVTI